MVRHRSTNRQKRSTKRIILARSRNLFVHISTCRRACEAPNEPNTRGYVQAMHTSPSVHKLEGAVDTDNKRPEDRLEIVTNASKDSGGKPDPVDKDEERPEYRLEIVTLPPPATRRPTPVIDEERFYPDECFEPFDKGILTRHCSGYRSVPRVWIIEACSH